MMIKNGNMITLGIATTAQPNLRVFLRSKRLFIN